MCVHFDKRKRVAFLLKTSQALEREKKKWKKRRADRARVRRGTVFQNEAEKRGETKWTIRVPMRHCLTAEKGRKALQLGPRRPTMSQKFDLQAKIQPLCFVKIPNQKLFSYNVLLDRQRQPAQSCFMPRPINCSIVPAFMYPC